MTLDLTQEQIQDFSDRVAEICEEMDLNPDQMLDAIGSTLIAAVMSFERSDYRVEIPNVATAKVETVFEAALEVVE